MISLPSVPKHYEVPVPYSVMQCPPCQSATKFPYFTLSCNAPRAKALRSSRTLLCHAMPPVPKRYEVPVLYSVMQCPPCQSATKFPYFTLSCNALRAKALRSSRTLLCHAMPSVPKHYEVPVLYSVMQCPPCQSTTKFPYFTLSCNALRAKALRSSRTLLCHAMPSVPKHYEVPVLYSVMQCPSCQSTKKFPYFTLSCNALRAKALRSSRTLLCHAMPSVPKHYEVPVLYSVMQCPPCQSTTKFPYFTLSCNALRAKALRSSRILLCQAMSSVPKH